MILATCIHAGDVPVLNTKDRRSARFNPFAVLTVCILATDTVNMFAKLVFPPNYLDICCKSRAQQNIYSSNVLEFKSEVLAF